MRQLTILTRNNDDLRNARHWAAQVTGKGTHYATLCGFLWSESKVAVLTQREARTYRPCRNCLRAAAKKRVDSVMPEANVKATERAAGLGFEEISARVFRVQGSTDYYTVTIPTDPHLATLCNCMAGKTRPDLRCKHQTAVMAELETRGEMVT